MSIAGQYGLIICVVGHLAIIARPCVIILFTVCLFFRHHGANSGVGRSSQLCLFETDALSVTGKSHMRSSRVPASRKGYLSCYLLFDFEI